MKLTFVTCVLLYLCSFGLPVTFCANQATYLNKFIKLARSSKSQHVDSSESYTTKAFSPVYVGPQDGLMESDKIKALPGQPEGVNFDQYAGYVTVDPKNGRALFYYFVESPENSSTNPLVLWLNGGPGCSSLGFGAMEELGPFRVNPDGKTLYRNDYAWNEAANVIFLESPAGVGFSYSNTTSDYELSGDQRTAHDAYAFLVNWLERFPQYKTRDFFITGESYAGHYVPQLADTILLNNNVTNQTVINLKGIAIGNAFIDYDTSTLGIFDYFWTHALNSDETNAAFHAKCHFPNETGDCIAAQNKGRDEIGNIDIFNIYAPLCHSDEAKGLGSLTGFPDPCSDHYVYSYLNNAEVQKALHANVTSLPYPWNSCSLVIPAWNDMPASVLPTIKQIISSGTSVWIYSGDMDGRIPVTASRYAINKLGYPVQTAWRPWSFNDEVGGYAVGYKGLVFSTVRGSGHMVPADQPGRALKMFSSFLKGQIPR